MAELIRLGAYRRGSDPEIDLAIAYYPQLERFLSQAPREHASLAQGYAQLATILDGIDS
jgi:flagellum-specific ATP synthase